VSGVAVTWLGHATVLLELAGTRLLTDSLLRGRVAHLRRRVPPPAPPGRLDAVLVSHLHRDHLDLPSLRGLDAGVVIVPRGGARVVRGLSHEIVELAAGDELAVRGVSVRAVEALHDGRRSPVGRPADAIGFIVAQSLRIYFAGDTELFDAMAGFAPLDVALLPVAGWGPRLGPGHMDAEQAAAAAALLRPDLAVPIHWGTLAAPALRRGDPDEPPRRFRARCAVLAPTTRVELLRPGESLALA